MQKTRMKKSTLPFWVKEAAVTAVGLIVCGLIVAFLSGCAAGTGGAWDGCYYWPEDHTDQYQRQNAELYHDRQNSSPANPAPSVPQVPEIVHQDNGNHQGGGNNGNGQGNGGGNGTGNEGNGKGPNK